MNGKELEFGTSGYTMDSVFVLYDRDSDSIWYPSESETMEAVAGPRKGESIQILDEPAPMSLADWIALEPGTLVLLPTEEEVAYRKRAYLGVQLEEEEGALRITGVSPDSPASVAGALTGDLIVGMNEMEIYNSETLRACLEGFSVGGEVMLILERGEETLELLVEFTPR